MKVLKRNGDIDIFNDNKIKNAIRKAFEETNSKNNAKMSLKILNETINKITESVVENINTMYDDENSIVKIEEIQDEVECALMMHGYYEIAKAYVLYRYDRTKARTQFDCSIEGLLNYTNIDVINENSNKNSHLISTQRDLIAGEVSKDYFKRKILPKHLLKTHDNGILHFHDADYVIQKGIVNCCLINLEDMFTNGTVINNKLVETPKSFSTACTIATQIIAQIASGQYGLRTAV